MFKRNLIALSRMLGIPGLVVMTEQGAVARKITSSTLTITNPDGVDGDINIEGSGGGGASVIDSIADSDTTNAPSRNAVFDALANKSAVGHTHGSADVTDFAETVRDTIGAALVAGSNVSITVNDAGDTITITSTGGGATSVVGEAAVAGSAATDLTLSGLDLAAHEHYVIEIAVKNATGTNCNINMYFNGDTTATNYDEQRTLGNGTSNSAARGNDAFIFAMPASTSAISYGNMALDLDGKCSSFWHTRENTGTSIQHRMSALLYRTAANVTSITISSTTANSLAVGTYIKVWKTTT